MPFLPNKRLILAAALAVMAASSAQAFTFENKTTADGNTANVRGPDSRFSTGTNNSGSNQSVRPGFSSGNTSLQFGGQGSFNQRYNADRMFDSNNLLGRER